MHARAPFRQLQLTFLMRGDHTQLSSSIIFRVRAAMSHDASVRPDHPRYKVHLRASAVRKCTPPPLRRVKLELLPQKIASQSQPETVVSWKKSS